MADLKDAFRQKIGGAHTTIIGGRVGRRVVERVAAHKEIKKIIPSVICVKNKSSGGFSAKALRPDERGNLRLLLAEGSSFQEIRLITTVGTVADGERIAEELNRLICGSK